MSKPLEDLVTQTRRLSRPRSSSDTVTSRKRRGEKTLQTTRGTGGLPAPRIVEPETLAEPPKSDLFDDFTIFGERISNLMSEANQRQSRPRRCTPFTTTNDSQVILRPRRSRSRDNANNEPRPPAPDAAAHKLAGVGVAVFSVLAIAMVVLSAPNKQTESQAVARKPIATETFAPEEFANTESTEELPAVIAGLVEEPSSE